jgi:hypothetical protein
MTEPNEAGRTAPTPRQKFNFPCPIDRNDPVETWVKETPLGPKRWFRCSACGREYPANRRNRGNDDPRRRMPI